jgi:SWI/SNF-related matrix-associated actin-dependent regulator of chromatin subfamily A3
MSSYIGELDQGLGNLLLPQVQRGLLRLEGFILRIPHDIVRASSDNNVIGLHADATQNIYQIKINILLFTLPSNVKYITDALIANNTFLLDPAPPYDPARHNEHPEYHNGHGSGEIGVELQQRFHRELNMRQAGMYAQPMQDKAISTEVLQKRQVDEVFKHLENPGELEFSSPGERSYRTMSFFADAS